MGNIARVIALTGLVLVTVWLILRSTSAIDFRTEHLEGLAADKIVEYQGVRMRQGDFILHHIVEEQHPVAAALVSQRSTTLWIFLYALWGMMGSYLYYLLRITRGEKSRSPGTKAAARFVARILLAGLCGVACFLLINFLSSPLGRLIGSWTANPSEDWTLHSVSNGFLFVPFTAGVFVGTFYQHLEGIFNAIMTRIQQLISGGEKGE